jgi:hypothetical protein
MKTSSFTLIPNTTFGTAVGNYDGIATTFTGDPEKAAAYYSKDKSVQTISWYLSGFVGIIKIEATLDDDQNSTNYFTIQELGDGVAALTENDYVNLEGNYTWIRVRIESFTAGVIEKISMGY